MGDVIGLPRAQRTAHRGRTVRSYGIAFGLEVVLLTDADADTVSPLRLGLVAPRPTRIEDLAVLPNSDEGRAAADTISAMVLHALQIAEHEALPGGAA